MGVSKAVIADERGAEVGTFLALRSGSIADGVGTVDRGPYDA